VIARRYRLAAARARAAAVRRGIVQLPAGRTLDTRDRGFWSDLSWVSLLAGAWVMASPWIWGYDDVAGAIEVDLLTGGAIVIVSLAGVLFPALWTLNVLLGAWLVIAPWIVGYGHADGPVGLSDSLTGVLLCAVAIAGISSAQRALRPGQSGAIGRITPERRSHNP
jgi:hypothetical protein